MNGFAGVLFKVNAANPDAAFPLAGLDIDIAVANESHVSEGIARLAEIGYQHRGDLGIAGREAFKPPSSTFPHHPYLVVAGNEQFTRHIAFRDRLRRDGKARAEYEVLKRRLAARHRNDPENYSYSKTEFVERVLAEELGSKHVAGPRQQPPPHN